MLCKIWGFHGGDYEECRRLGYKNPVRTSQETHYVSATQHSQLMLCKIWGFHCSDYEECRLLGYKSPVRTSQETRYFCVTELSQLMLYKISGFHDGDFEECHRDTHGFTSLETAFLRSCTSFLVTFLSHETIFKCACDISDPCGVSG
jgi:hypothetical protein